MWHLYVSITLFNHFPAGQVFPRLIGISRITGNYKINFCNAFNSIYLSSLPFFIGVNFWHTEIPVARNFTTCSSLYSVREYNKTSAIFCEHTTCLPHARTRGSKRNSSFLFAFHVPFMILYSTITSPSASSFLSRKILLHLFTLL